jgi:predicted nucleic acid-binding protein
MALPKLHFYIETSVWSHWFAEDVPDRRAETRAFLHECRNRGEQVEIYVGRPVLDELAAAPAGQATQLLSLVGEYAPAVVESTPEAVELVAAYLAHGALSPGSVVDATHAALATVHGMDVLVSWNCRHLANLSRRRRINGVSSMLGYTGSLDILTPMEIFEDAGQ